MDTFNTYPEFKEAIVKIVNQRIEVLSDESLSAEEFVAKDRELELKQWTLCKEYPEWYDRWFDEVCDNFLKKYDN